MADKIDCTLDDVNAALAYINVDDREEWRIAGMAIKSEFGEGGCSTWMDWSQGYKKFKQAEANSVWKSFKGRGITIGSLFGLALDRGFTFAQKEQTKEEKAAFAKACEERRIAREAELLQEEADAQLWYAAVAKTANQLKTMLKPMGSSPYLGIKRVRGFGIYFAPHSFVIKTNDDFSIEIFSGGDSVNAFFKSKKETDSFVFFKKDSILIPLCDFAGTLQNFQIIFTNGEKKRFLTNGRKSGYFHVIGEIPNAELPIVFCEGYATGASIHMATGWPVVVCFDAGNMPVVAEQFKDFRNVKICAGDNDWETALDPKKKNTGIVKAKEAAAVCGGAWCVPEFSGDAAGLSDFNDLHVAQGGLVVKAQLDRAVELFHAGNVSYEELPPVVEYIPASAYEDYVPLDDSESLPADSPAPTFEKAATIELLIARYKLIIPNGKIWDSFKKVEIPRKTFELSLGSKAIFNEWIAHPDCGQVDLSEVREEKSAAEKEGGGELGAVLARYIYLDPSSEAWDSERGELVALNDLRYSIASVFDQWLKHPKRLSMPKANLVFDPTQKVNAETHINLFRGLPVGPSPDSSKCLNIIRLIRHLCNCPMDANELVKSTQRYRDSHDAYQWLMRWIALPLQKVGTKMHTAVLMHGEVHGSGKSLLWGGVIKAIYGRYAGVFGQQQIESQYNEWQSGKLFGVFEEVLTRSSRYNHLGALKHLITSDRIRIEEKYRSGREENNHLNCAFLSNDIVPIPIEQYDRRMFVLVPEATLPIELQRSVAHEIENGGIEAFYGVLLQYDLAGFTKSTKPLMNQAKINLIENARAGWEVFFDEWKGGYLDVPFCSCLVRDLYRYYVGWCNERHETRVSMNRFSGFIASKRVERAQDAHYVVNASYTSGTKKGNFFIVGSAPEGMAVQVWLGGCVSEFARIIAQSNFVSEAA